MPEPRNTAWHLGALALYASASYGFIAHGAPLTKTLCGAGFGPFAFIWFLSWCPWALAHHLNPLFTNLIWQPAGLNLAWTTSVPLLALLGLPFTALSSPVLAL